MRLGSSMVSTAQPCPPANEPQPAYCVSVGQYEAQQAAQIACARAGGTWQTTGPYDPGSCYTPPPVAAAAPSVNVNVSPNIQTAVSPQISPSFVQQYQPTGSPVTTGANQQAGGATGAAAPASGESALDQQLLELLSEQQAASQTPSSGLTPAQIAAQQSAAVAAQQSQDAAAQAAAVAAQQAQDQANTAAQVAAAQQAAAQQSAPSPVASAPAPVASASAVAPAPYNTLRYLLLGAGALFLLSNNSSRST